MCESRRADSGESYVFVIDEINRGNLSKILGELMLLVENDKRSAKWAVKLAYSDNDAPSSTYLRTSTCSGL
jgi:AAA domain (dynein-related subfamily)